MMMTIIRMPTIMRNVDDGFTTGVPVLTESQVHVKGSCVVTVNK